MPNRDAPSGFFPVRHLSGGYIRQTEYEIAGGLANAIFTGDPVKTSPGTNKRIDVAAAGNVLVGVFGGCQYVEPDGSIKFSRHWPAAQAIKTGTVAKAFVWDDPSIIFGIQCDGTFTATMVGQLIDFNFDQAGNTSTGVSGCEADIASVAGSGEPLKILGLLPQVGNSYGAFAVIEVIISTHENLTRGAVAT